MRGCSTGTLSGYTYAQVLRENNGVFAAVTAPFRMWAGEFSRGYRTNISPWFSINDNVDAASIHIKILSTPNSDAFRIGPTYIQFAPDIPSVDL
jgi:hypothetical protein